MIDDQGKDSHLRIGALSRRVGVSPETLRAWERRYGLFTPSRSAGGYRLYGDEDERRVRRMLEHLQRGVSAAQAAQLARADQASPANDGPGATPALDALRTHLRLALDQFDEAGAQAALDELLAAVALETVLRDAILPYLNELGERWRRSEASIAQEHFATALLRGRLLGLGRGWGNGDGHQALLACLPGDQHDLGLICFGLALRNHGWRITFLGTDTPLVTITETAHRMQPTLVVVTAALAKHAADAKDGLVQVAHVAPLAIAGGGANPGIAATIGARYLGDDPVTAATKLSGMTASADHAAR